MLRNQKKTKTGRKTAIFSKSKKFKQVHKFNSCKSEKELINFEKENKITLPLGYRTFLKQIGNGGAGPYYGLEPLESGREVDLDYKNGKDLLDLSKPFPYSESWNIDFDKVEKITDENNEKLEFLDWYELWLDKSIEEKNKNSYSI